VPNPSNVHTRPRLSGADVITLARIPLAVAFPFAQSVTARLLLLGAAAATDFSDGWVARRFGSSRLGAILDPIADKLFMASAFGVVLVSGKLAPLEVAAVVSRDLVASIAFFITVARRRSTAIPARAGGKAVTLLQLFTLVAFVLDSTYLRPLAWATAAVALYAIYDYSHPFFRKLRTR
jgi:cardiolipin synthase